MNRVFENRKMGRAADYGILREHVNYMQLQRKRWIKFIQNKGMERIVGHWLCVIWVIEKNPISTLWNPFCF
ncbi:hypothetical protein [Lysinibacillus xylanilyticus]|uniref:Uncharacterized protein n=1 Tax=Lysinibacillus xylanilyticus TaxID=582475 RepID=A0A2M9Q5P5_9BACI|nr:hypothetical protein [Lysinibacillus xylanilyticus]PJO43403.1 hypothetical protein CWD94_12700 [Lysinibacillus xylanilyticus]